MKSRSYRDLVAGSGADLYGQVFLVSKSFPADEMYVMTSQMRRAASSIKHSRRTKAWIDKEFAHFAYCMARVELDTQVSFVLV
jgi:four helix bundle protein